MPGDQRPNGDPQNPAPEITGVVRVVASDKNWIVSEAVQQLRSVAKLPGMRLAVGMPDLHPGKGGPVGGVFVSQGVVYPHLAGNDIGCGMGLWQTDLSHRKLKLDRWTKKLKGLDGPWEGDPAAWLSQDKVPCSSFESSLGTIGFGNHFAELQTVEEVRDTERFASWGLDAEQLQLLVHSGSRGFGESILRKQANFAIGGLATGSAACQEYCAAHDHAVNWARSNRALIAQRFLWALGAAGVRVLDLCHNSITPPKVVSGECRWLHRKGAAPSDAGPVVIPGSRGAFSFLVHPIGDQQANGFSVAHGAGRKWTRSDARGRLEQRYRPEDLERTELGSRVICKDKDLLYEEAPQAYKNIEIVVQDLVDAGLVQVVAVLRPLITYKTRGGETHRAEQL